MKINRERGITYLARRFVSEKENLEMYHTRILRLTKPAFNLHFLEHEALNVKLRCSIFSIRNLLFDRTFYIERTYVHVCVCARVRVY